MRIRTKIGLGVLGLFVAFVVWIFLEANGVIPHTRTLQSFQIDSRTTIKISMIDGSDPETFGCVFEVRTNGRVAIPRAEFDGGMRSGSPSDHYGYYKDTRYLTLAGPRSRVVGIASTNEPEVMLVVIDLNDFEFFDGFGWNEPPNRPKGEALVERLASDFPGKTIFLYGSEAARLMWWKKHYGDSPPPTPEGKFTN